PAPRKPVRIDPTAWSGGNDLAVLFSGLGKSPRRPGCAGAGLAGLAGIRRARTRWPGHRMRPVRDAGAAEAAWRSGLTRLQGRPGVHRLRAQHPAACLAETAARAAGP